MRILTQEQQPVVKRTTTTGCTSKVYSFDIWNNMTVRSGKHWSHTNFFSGTYVNNRKDDWQYDADGRTMVANNVTSSYDAAGQFIQTAGPRRRNNPPLTLTQSFDGDGHRVKNTEYGGTWYWLYSSALGGKVVCQIFGTPGSADYGRKWRGYVYANGVELAQQNPTIYYEVFDSFTDPSGAKQNGTELDPLGDDAATEDPYTIEGGDPGFAYPFFGDITDSGIWLHRRSPSLALLTAFKYAAVARIQISVSGYYSDTLGGFVGGGRFTRVYGSASRLLGSSSQQAADGSYSATVTVSSDESGALGSGSHSKA
jgi:hypothetical protein